MTPKTSLLEEILSICDITENKQHLQITGKIKKDKSFVKIKKKCLLNF